GSYLLYTVTSLQFRVIITIESLAIIDSFEKDLLYLVLIILLFFVSDTVSRLKTERYHSLFFPSSHHVTSTYTMFLVDRVHLATELINFSIFLLLPRHCFHSITVQLRRSNQRIPSVHSTLPSEVR